MRVTRESLIKIARETAQERAYNDKDIIAAYLTGSLANDDLDPMLGGTADIDIIFVHKGLLHRVGVPIIWTGMLGCAIMELMFYYSFIVLPNSMNVKRL